MARNDLPLSALDDITQPLSSADLMLLTQETPDGPKSAKIKILEMIALLATELDKNYDDRYLKRVHHALGTSGLLGLGTVDDLLQVDPQFVKDLVPKIVAGTGITVTSGTDNTLTIASNIINTLTSDSSTSSLSAKQGKVLKELIDKLAKDMLELENKFTLTEYTDVPLNIVGAAAQEAFNNFKINVEKLSIVAITFPTTPWWSFQHSSDVAVFNAINIAITGADSKERNVFANRYSRIKTSSEIADIAGGRNFHTIHLIAEPDSVISINQTMNCSVTGALESLQGDAFIRYRILGLGNIEMLPMDVPTPGDNTGGGTPGGGTGGGGETPPPGDNSVAGTTIPNKYGGIGPLSPWPSVTEDKYGYGLIVFESSGRHVWKKNSDGGHAQWSYRLGCYCTNKAQTKVLINEPFEKLHLGQNIPVLFTGNENYGQRWNYRIDSSHPDWKSQVGSPVTIGAKYSFSFGADWMYTKTPPQFMMSIGHADALGKMIQSHTLYTAGNWRVPDANLTTSHIYITRHLISKTSDGYIFGIKILIKNCRQHVGVQRLMVVSSYCGRILNAPASITSGRDVYNVRTGESGTTEDRGPNISKQKIYDQILDKGEGYLKHPLIQAEGDYFLTFQTKLTKASPEIDVIITDTEIFQDIRTSRPRLVTEGLIE